MDEWHWDYSCLSATKRTITARVAMYNNNGVQMSEAEDLQIVIDLAQSYHDQVMSALAERPSI